MSLPQETLNRYKSDIFVETGTHIGDGIRKALTAGFKKVYTMDTVEKYVNRARKKTKGKNVEFYVGRSTDILPGILRQLKSKTTFWLDAHPGGPLTIFNAPGREYSPVLDELKLILIYCHDLPGLALMIDDVRLFLPEELEELKKVMMQITGNKVTLADGHRKNDILVSVKTTND